MNSGIGTPDPYTEIHATPPQTIRGANYWSRRPITRTDVQLGAYEDISSADLGYFTDQLVAALPGLDTHECSIGTRGGFIQRLREGTYAAHIIEHVALELQSMIGHEVGYGRTRGTGAVGEYTVVFDHIHEGVGRRAATLALAIVQDAFAGTLNGSEHAVGELRAIAATPALAQPHRHVLCGITGGIGRTETHVALTTLGIGNRTDDAALVDIPPLDLLQMGLPYTSSDIAIILDAAPIDVPERYRDSDRAARLMSIVADGVQQNGIVLCPDNAPHIHDWVRRAHRRIVTFHSDDDILVRAQRAARVAADTLKASMNEPAKMDVNAR